MASVAEAQTDQANNEHSETKVWHYLDPTTGQSSAPVSVYQLAGEPPARFLRDSHESVR